MIRHRVYVMLDDDPLENSVAAKSRGTLLDVPRNQAPALDVPEHLGPVLRLPERIRGLEGRHHEQVELLQAQLAQEQERNIGLEESYRKERGERDRNRYLSPSG